MVDHSQVMLGRKPPLPAERSRRVAFATVFGDVLPPPPETRDWTCGEKTRPMFGNDEVGDCTAAAMANNVIGVTRVAYKENIGIATGQVLRLYSDTTSPPYNASAPLVGGVNPTDNGAVFEDVTNYVLRHGFCGHHMVGSVSIEPTNAMHVRQGIDKFGVVNVGISLPLAWQNAATWSLDGYDASDPRWQLGGWGGHETCSQLYTTEGLYLWTWGGLQLITWDAVAKFCDEIDGPVWASWIRAGYTPGGDSLDVLEKYMEALRRTP